MILPQPGSPFRVRIILAVVLSLCAIALTGGEFLTGHRNPRAGDAPMDRRRAEAEIAATVDTLVARYGIDPKRIHTWRATAGGQPTGRIEQRILVGSDFVSLKFNHELLNRLASFAARVVATERTKENIVIMHIVREGKTIRSLVFEADTGR